MNDVFDVIAWILVFGVQNLEQFVLVINQSPIILPECLIVVYLLVEEISKCLPGLQVPQLPDTVLLKCLTHSI